MANNPYTNKVVLADGTVLIDLTGDDVSASDVLSGKKVSPAQRRSRHRLLHL